jgi:hypothetical protein
MLAVAVALSCATDPRALAQTLASRDAVHVRDVSVAGNTVTGTLVNSARNEVRDIVVLINRAWIWTDEKNPGEINPGGSYYVTLPVTIPAGGTAKFEHKLPEVSAPPQLGSFQVSVAVQGYTEVEYRAP